MLNRLILLLVFTTILFSCSEPEEQEITLVGQWELNLICFSDGASQCGESELKAPDFKETLNFKSDGTISFIRDGNECVGTYVYDGKEMLELEADDTDCNFDKTTFRVFQLTANTVTINPPCREACIKKYIRQ